MSEKIKTTSPIIVKAGHILKWTNYVQGYKKRYFSLNGDVLVYYNDEKKSSIVERG